MMPMPIMHMVNDDPPTLTNGNVMPVKGMAPVTTAMLIKAWKVIQQVNPRANKRPKSSGALAAMRSPR